MCEETSDHDNLWELTTQDFTTGTGNMHFPRSQLMSSHGSTEVKSALRALAATLVPEIWVEETANQLANLAGQVGTRLRILSEERLDSNVPRVVEVTILTITVVKPEEGSHPTLLHYFQLLGEGMREIVNADVYKRANISSSSITPTNQFEPDDCCAICREEYSDTGADDNSGGGGSSSSHQVQDIVITSCSLKYHSKCLFGWLRVKHECPLYRFGLSDDYEVIVILAPVIYDLTL
ncbi:hypothetical protein SAY86_022696 [Trapa natans]|uniref:RING-type domain-containing protein n=1 Tax=Trapa natans TaxID=22666 RepID=A0AAN7M970_TRANT|nr:hypothetical protein SAY86_022696 [Trapa natans]